MTIIGDNTANDLIGSVAADRILGLAGHDVLVGLAGADFLDGGSGKDVMIGGAGNDVYVVDSIGDIVAESVDEGIDQVRSSITFNMAASSSAGVGVAYVENLTLTGTAAISGFGNGLDNVISGNGAGNSLF